MTKIENNSFHSGEKTLAVTPHAKSRYKKSSFQNRPHFVHTTQTTLPTTEYGDSKTIKQSQNNRINIYNLRYTAGQILGGRTANCGHSPIGDDVYYSKKPNSNLFVAGVETCCNANACPVCALKIVEQRRLAVYNILLAFRQKQNVSMGFLTLTVQHHIKDTFKTVYNWTYKAWLKTIQSKKYRELGMTFKKVKNKNGREIFARLNGKKIIENDKYKHIGDIRAVETKISNDNGYHVHQHIAIVCECTPDELKEYATSIIGIYMEQVRKINGEQKEGEQKGYASIKGQNYTPIYNVEGVNNYISKWELSDELTKSNAKVRSYKRSYTPFGLLNEVLNKVGTAEHQSWCIKMFKDYSEGIKGTRSLSISALLKTYFQNEITEQDFIKYAESLEKTDEEILMEEAKEIQASAKVILTISRKCYLEIGREKIHAHCLNEFEHGQGLIGLQMFLLELGIFTTYEPIAQKLWLEEELLNFVPKNKSNKYKPKNKNK